jgi:hypothetical protein
VFCRLNLTRPCVTGVILEGIQPRAVPMMAPARHTPQRRSHIMDRSTTTFDADALDFAATPAWYDRHPSQAEGADF